MDANDLKPRSLDALGAQARGFFRRYLPGTDAWLWPNFTAVTAKVLALTVRQIDLRIDWLYRQLFVRTTTWLPILRMHGADYRIYLKPAAAAAGPVTGAGQPGAAYPAGVRWLSGMVTYVATSGFTAAGDGSFVALVQAETTGSATNRDAGAPMTLVDPALYPTLSDEAEAGVGGLGGGADVEDIEAFRARILDRKARPPQGGALPDYERFALEVPGVVKAWAFQFTNGIGSVAVFFLFAGRPNLIPDAGDVAAVQAYIDAKRLIRVDDAVAVAPVAAPVNVTIADLAVDTDEVRAAIAANLASMFLARARPGVTANPFVLSRSWIGEAISAATGEDSHTLVTPASDLSFDDTYPVLGTVTYA